MGHEDIPFINPPEVKIPDDAGVVDFTTIDGDGLEDEVEKREVAIPERRTPDLSLEDLGLQD